MLTQVQAEPILFLKTYDRHTGVRKTHPVFYRRYGKHFVIVASNEASHHKPDWYLDIKEEPFVEVEFDGADYFAVASTPVGADRLDIWPIVEALSQDVDRYLPRNVTGVVLSLV